MTSGIRRIAWQDHEDDYLIRHYGHDKSGPECAFDLHRPLSSTRFRIHELELSRGRTDWRYEEWCGLWDNEKGEVAA